MVNQLSGHRKRLRERFLKSGIKGLHDYEIVELFLMYSIPRKDCKPLAKELLKKYKTISNVFNLSEEELLKIEGIGESSVAFFRLIKEIFKIYLKEDNLKGKYINNTINLVDFLRADIGDLKNEVFKVIFLDNQNKFLEEETLFSGCLDKNYIYPREILKKVFYYNAKSIIFSHNHPAGTLKPSNYDINITNKIKNILKELDINLLDHIIISNDGYFSFLENDLI